MKNFSEKTLIERIKALRKAFAGVRGKSKFAKALGISPSTYSYYEKDRIPPIPVLLKMCQLCNKSISWLLTGEESPEEDKVIKSNEFTDNNRADRAPNTSEEKTPPLLSEYEFKAMMKKLEKLARGSPLSLQTILALLELIEQKNELERNVSRQADIKTRRRWIPVLGRTAAGPIGMWNQTNLADSEFMETTIEQLVNKHLNSNIIKAQQGVITTTIQTTKSIAGEGSRNKLAPDQTVSLIQTTLSDSDEICQFIDCPAIMNLYPDCFALQIDGDSMSPRINDGDIVIISPSVPAVQGKPAIVSMKGAIGVTCKLIRSDNDKVYLVPINEKYETKVMNTDAILWALAVLCHIKVKNIEL